MISVKFNSALPGEVVLVGRAPAADAFFIRDRIRKWLSRLGLVPILVVGPYGAGCQDNPSPDRPAVAVGLSRLRISIPVMVALHERLFEKHGVQVELHTFETAQPLTDALMTGDVAAGGFVAFPITMSAEQRNLSRLAHVGLLVEDVDHPVSRFLVRKGAGIERLGDLEGKRVGVLPTVAYRAWLDLLLRSANVDPEQVTVQNIAPAMSAAALDSGVVDALFTNDPAATAALASGKASLLQPEPRVGQFVVDPLPFGSFAMRSEFVDEHPAEACAIARAIDEAITMAMARPASAQAALQQYLPETQAPLIPLYPLARYQVTAEVEADALDKLARRYAELGIVEQPVAPALFTESSCPGIAPAFAERAR